MQAWKEYQEKNKDRFLNELLDLLRIPSISAKIENKADMVTCAEAVKARLLEAGADKVVIYETAGHPVVYGEKFVDASKPTVLVYGHYDVQPVDPLNLWNSPPFEPTIKDGKIFARGSADDKGQFYMHVKALETMVQTNSLTTNIKFIIEGEEEIGSPNLREFFKKYPGKLQTDGIIWEGGSKNISGHLQIVLGVKGICYVELRCTGAKNDLHSSNAAIVENPAWKLVWALSTLKNNKDEILIDGFYDQIKKPTYEDMNYLEDILYEEEEMKRSMGITNFINNLTGIELKKKLLYEPTCNISGMESGYIGKGSKTVLPSLAKVKIDFRLVPNQKPEEIIPILRKHLDNNGFENIEIIYMSGKNPYLTDSNSLLVKTVIENVERIYGMPPIIYRNEAATTAMGILHEFGNIPAVLFGVSNDESNMHGPNENIYLKDYIDGIKFTATIIHEFAKKTI